jgi:hypothetical protein
VSVIDRKAERQEHEERLKLEEELHNQAIQHQRELRNQQNQENERLQEMLRILGPSISTILATADAGVRIILPKRKHCEEAEDAIQAHLLDEATRNISIAAIALPEFFHPREKYGDALRIRFKADDVHWRILLLDPQSRAARQRADREKGNDTIDHIKQSIRHIQGEMDKGEDIEARLFSFPPILFLLITDNSMLVEPYHFGRVVQPGANTTEPDDAEPGCNGGLVPLLQIQNLSGNDKPYAIFSDHFEYIWKHCSTPVYSAIRVCEPDSTRRVITLDNSHMRTGVRLGGWYLEATCETKQHGQAGAIKEPRQIYTFLQKDVLESSKRLELVDSDDPDSYAPDWGIVHHIRRGSAGSLAEFMDAFWKDEHRELRLFNRRGRVVAKYPNDGYVGSVELLSHFPGGDVY